MAMVCLLFLALMIFLSVVCPMISGYSASEQHQDHGLMPMGYTHTETVDGKAVSHTHLWGTDKFGRDLFTRVWMGAVSYTHLGHPAERPDGGPGISKEKGAGRGQGAGL